MGETTNISWTKVTFNPWVGCTQISPGCNHCYAAASDRRFTGGQHWGAGAPRRRTVASNWRNPLRWNNEAQKSGEFWPVFAASQADIFDNEVDPAWREDFWELVRATPALTWQIVTKRVGNVRKMLPPDWGDGYPNVWLGITVVNQLEADRDIPKLFLVPASLRFLSVEPMLAGIDLTRIVFEDGYKSVNALTGVVLTNLTGGAAVHNIGPKIDWVITGGESKQPGQPARAFDLAWADLIAADCANAGIPFFMKQTGHNAVQNYVSYLVTGKGDEPDGWPESLRKREFPGGRTLHKESASTIKLVAWQDKRGVAAP